VVTGLVLGNANISYTVTNSCGTARAIRTVTVTPLGGGRSGNNANQTTSTTIETGITVYPNPTTTTAINIKASEAGTFYLYTMDGKELNHYNIEAETNVINLPDALAEGIYMGVFKGNIGASAVVRIVFRP